MKQFFTQPTKLQLLFVNALFAGLFLSLYLFRHPFSILSFKESSGGLPLLNMEFWYDASKAHQIIQDYTTESMHIYNRITVLDMAVLIPLYTTAIVQWAHFLCMSTFNRKKLLPTVLVFACIAAIANYGQDVTVRHLLFLRPTTNETIAAMSGWLSAAKFSALGIAAILLFKAWLDYRKMNKLS